MLDAACNQINALVTHAFHRSRTANHQISHFTRQTHEINVVMVNWSLALLSSFATIGALSGSADDVLPPRFNFDRYTRMVDQSPFAIATAAALPEATPDFAKDLYIANAARSPEGDLVTIRSSSDQNFKKYLNTREPVDGYSISHIDWSEDVGKTKVTISKDGKFATLTFNQALLAQQQGPPNARSAPAGGRQAAPVMPPSVPTQPSHPRTQRVVEKDRGAVPAPTPNVVPPSKPSRAAIAGGALDSREGTYLPKTRQQNDDALTESEREEMEEAARK